MDVCEEREGTLAESGVNEPPPGTKVQDVWLVCDIIELVRPSSGHSLTISGDVLTDEERRELVSHLIDWVHEIRKGKKQKT